MPMMISISTMLTWRYRTQPKETKIRNKMINNRNVRNPPLSKSMRKLTGGPKTLMDHPIRIHPHPRSIPIRTMVMPSRLRHITDN